MGHPNCSQAPFQSTLPLRGATVFQLAGQQRPAISIHAPLTGSDSCKCRFHFAALDFNPRSPYGERRQILSDILRAWNFNPRSPYGERLLQLLFPAAQRLFQSTLPLRGATGCHFCRRPLEWISIHAPLTGSDPRRTTCPSRIRISIHAPLTGSDLPIAATNTRINYFNPRSPYGERLHIRAVLLSQTGFQSTLPLRGATICPASQMEITEISIHAPLTGSD